MNAPAGKVMKFGGSCLAGGPAMRRIATIVGKEPLSPALVVSALPGVTDQLLEAAKEAAHQKPQVTADRAADLTAKHLELARQITGQPGLLARLERSIRALGQRLERALLAVTLGEEITSGLRAMVVSIGERWSARLMAAALEEGGLAALAVDTDRVLVTRDDTREDAGVDLPASRRRARAAWQSCRRQGKIPVFTGFFGATPEGRVATFGRNGSDYSAAVLAVLLGASELEIWKDVAGFASADPKRIAGARPLPRLSFAEAAELAYFGAAILHPRTLEPLAGLGVRVRLRPIDDPDHAGTRVEPGKSSGEPGIKGVTIDAEIAVLRVEGPAVGIRPGVIGRIGDALAAAGVNIHSVLTSQTSINLLVARDDTKKGLAALEKIVEQRLERISARRDLSLLAVVGEGMPSLRGAAGRIFSAVSQAGVNVEMIVSGASNVATYFLVADGDANRALAALHRELFP